MKCSIPLIFCAGLLLLALPGIAVSSSYSFVQMGDPQIGMTVYSNDLDRFRQAVQQINRLNPAFVVICGDMVETAGSNSFADFSAARAELTVPSYCIPGNHDVGYKPTPESLKLYRQSIGKDYFSFVYQNDRFVCANAQLWKAPLNGESPSHDQWFMKTLSTATNPAQRLFVVMHYPPFTEHPDEKEHMFNLPLAARRNILSACKNAGVSALLAGHAHRTITNSYASFAIVVSETTSLNIDKRPWGFRLWHVGPGDRLCHQFVPLQ